MSFPSRPLPWAILLILFLPACPTTPEPPEYPLDLDEDEAARIVIGRLAGVEGLRAEIEVTFASDDDTRSASGALVALKPDRVRMQCWGPLGSTVLDLAVRGDRATLYLPREMRAVRIDLARLAGSPDEDYRSLLLVDSLLDELSIASMEYRREAGPSADRASLVVVEDGKPVSRIVYSRRTLLPVSRQRLVEPRYVVRFDDYRPFGGRWWPGEIRVDAGARRLRIEVDALEENPEVADALFEIRLPEGVEVEDR